MVDDEPSAGAPSPAPFPFAGDVRSAAARVWSVGALCKAAADTLEARFNPLTVAGEISAFARAASGHCYFTLKDGGAQLRCAMFRRGASLLDFSPREGDRVQARGRLGVYEARGDLQLVVESLQRADGVGAWFEQFLRLKARLQAEGLFEPARKRNLPTWPRGIGVVTSLGAAALHDVVTTLKRRVPHLPVVLAPASVQGAQAPAELCAALNALYAMAQAPPGTGEHTVIDVILLVRGGGAPEELAAFNDEALARTIVRSPVPLVSGVGHETDVTIADFCADVRAATPTAAAELVAQAREVAWSALDHLQQRLCNLTRRQVDTHAMRVDALASRLGRPSAGIQRERERLIGLGHALQHRLHGWSRDEAQNLQAERTRLVGAGRRQLEAAAVRLEQARLRLGLLDPHQVLERGYAWLTDANSGRVLMRTGDATQGQAVRASLADGHLDLTVDGVTAHKGQARAE